MFGKVREHFLQVEGVSGAMVVVRIRLGVQVDGILVLETMAPLNAVLRRRNKNIGGQGIHKGVRKLRHVDMDDWRVWSSPGLHSSTRLTSLPQPIEM